MRVPAGRNVRRVHAIVGDRAGNSRDVELCVNTELHVLSGREETDLCLLYIGTEHRSPPPVTPLHTQLEHTQGIHLTPSMPP